VRQDCGADARKMPLEDWERNNHEAVRQATEEMAQRCLAEFARALGVAVPAPSPTENPKADAATETGASAPGRN
jgi:hypothetical protein